MSCTASRIFLKASCLLINFPSNNTVSSSLSDAAACVCGDSGEELGGNSGVPELASEGEDGRLNDSEQTLRPGLDARHREGGVFTDASGEIHGSLKLRETGGVRRGGFDDEDVS